MMISNHHQTRQEKEDGENEDALDVPEPKRSQRDPVVLGSMVDTGVVVTGLVDADVVVVATGVVATSVVAIVVYYLAAMFVR